MKIKEVNIEDEKVYLKKSKYLKEWKVVYPIKNEEGKINWFNLFFSSKGNLIFLILLVLIAGMFYVGVKDMLSSCEDMAENPCSYFGNLRCDVVENKYIKDMEKYPQKIEEINESKI